MTERLTLLWVHRKHPEFSDVGTGFQYVEAARAERLIAEGCAQDAATTDVKQLKYIDPSPAPIKPKPSVKNAVRKKIMAKPGRYKRRDMRAENGDDSG